jgi:circadian clock protein KaiB
MSAADPQGSGNDLMESAFAAQQSVIYVLRLYITGPTPQSTRAIVNTRKICEGYLQDRYQLEVIDIRNDPGRATTDQIIAAPTLIKISPAPVRRFIGDMSETARILEGLDIPKTADEQQ